jgi:hypothetical protein
MNISSNQHQVNWQYLLKCQCIQRCTMQDFGTKSDDTAGPNGQLSAAEFNNLATELENSVLRSGQALSEASDTQIAQSLFLHGVKSESFQDSGTANAYFATPVSGASGVLLPNSYTVLSGAVISLKAANTNSGASTLNIGQTTGAPLGTKKILSESGLDLSANSIIAGQYLQLKYDASLDSGAGAWVLLRWSSSAFALSGRVVFSTPGIFSWTVPPDVKMVRVKVIGAGGGGGRRAVVPGPAGGGGGGISEGVANLIGVSSVTVTVGAGGAGGATVGASGTAGGASSFGAFMSGGGGGGGLFDGSAEGASGIGIGGDLNYGIGAGSFAFQSDGTAFFGGYGGGGSSVPALTGAPAKQPGHGGGGRVTGPGINGANGAVIIEW